MNKNKNEKERKKIQFVSSLSMVKIFFDWNKYSKNREKGKRRGGTFLRAM
jgi:hypothetical protein